MGSCMSKDKSNNDSTGKQKETSDNTVQIDKKGSEPIDATASKGTVEKSYNITEELGRGAFSVVKKAKNRKTGEECAIKFIEKKFVDKQDMNLLAREIDIMKKVSHPNVLKLKEVFETDDIIALVMELITGGELFYKIVEKGNYSENDAANIVKQMLAGVAYLHEQGIAHRDLKPENLLCSGEEESDYKPFRTVIEDFGLSKNFTGGEQLETSCGTPDYVAPEVITAEGSYDKSVDMWSCGVITYVLLCGFSPFLSTTQTGLFEKIIKCDYDFPDPEWTNISSPAKDFIRHLLVKDPDQRYTAKQCLSHPWLNGQTGKHELGDANFTTKMNNYNKNYTEQRKATKKNVNN